MTTPRIESVMNGSSTCVMPTITAASVCIRVKLRPTKPIFHSVNGIKPPRPSSTIQPKVRTTTLVISGNTTRMISQSRSVGETRAMM
jgi:hypothetical protein